MVCSFIPSYRQKMDIGVGTTADHSSSWQVCRCVPDTPPYPLTHPLPSDTPLAIMYVGVRGCQGKVLSGE